MNQHKKDALLFKAFCDESRLRILEQLRLGERCACTLLDALTISQSTLSHHMKILIDSGLVIPRKEGKWTHYSIAQDGLELAKERLESVMRLNDLSVDECSCTER